MMICVITILTLCFLIYFFNKTLKEHFYIEDVLDNVCSTLSNGQMTEYNRGECVTSTCPLEECKKLESGVYRQNISKQHFRAGQCITKDDANIFKDCTNYTPPSPPSPPSYQQSPPSYQQSSPPSYQQSSPPSYQQSSPSPSYQQSSSPKYQQSSPSPLSMSQRNSQNLLSYSVGSSTPPTCTGSDHCFEYRNGKWIKTFYTNVLDNTTNTCVWRNIKTNEIDINGSLSTCLKQPTDCSSQNITCASDGKTIRYIPDASGNCVAINSCDTCDAVDLTCYTFNTTNREYEEVDYTQQQIVNGECSFVDENNFVLGNDDSCGQEIVLNCKDAFVCNGETYEPVYNVDVSDCVFQSTTSSKVMYNDNCPEDLTNRCSANRYYNEANGACASCGLNYKLTNRNGTTFEDACTIIDSCRVNYMTCYDKNCRMSIKYKVTKDGECVAPDDCEETCRIPVPPPPLRCPRNPWRRCIHPDDLSAEKYKYDNTDNCILKSKESDKTIEHCNPRCPATTTLSVVAGKLKCV